MTNINETQINFEKQRYQILGITLMLIGILFTQYFYFILKNISLTAFGISIIIISITIIFLADDSPSQEIIKSLIESICDNIETQLNFSDLNERCIYLPPRENKIFVYIPKNQSKTSKSSKNTEISPKATRSMSQTEWITIYLPLSFLLLNSVKEKSIEEALYEILVDQFKTIKSIKVVESNNKIIVKMIGSKIENSQPKFKQIFGSFNTMISGSIISYFKNKPLVIMQENIVNANITTTFEVIEINE